MDEDAYTRKELSSTIPYYQDDQTWCVAVAKPELLWKSFFKLFSPIEWLVIAIMIYMIAVVLYVISRIDGRRENIHWSLLASLSITMGLATVYEPRKANVRFMFLSFLFYGLIFSSAFHSFLVNVLTNPIQKEQVDNLAASVANGFRYAGGTVALSHYEGSDRVYITHTWRVIPFKEGFYAVFLYIAIPSRAQAIRDLRTHGRMPGPAAPPR